MATALDKDMRAAATAVLADVGAAVTLYPPVTTVFNATTGDLDVTDVTGASVKASPPLPMRREFALERPGIVMSDMLMFFDAVSVEAASVTPEVSGSVEHNGERRPILAVTELWSGAQIAAYEVAVRF